MILKEQIMELLLKGESGYSAQEIAEKLNSNKTTINGLLYDKMEHVFIDHKEGEKPFWSIRVDLPFHTMLETLHFFIELHERMPSTDGTIDEMVLARWMNAIDNKELVLSEDEMKEYDDFLDDYQYML